MREVELGGEKSFIGAWYIPDLKVCDELIEFFRQSEGKSAGEIGHNREVKPDIKDSLDLVITPDEFGVPVVRKYIINLFEVVKHYTDRYAYSKLVRPWGITENINLQYYQPGAGYKAWHTERIGPMLPSVNRHLVFMTYLNDVDDAGGTEFFHQKIIAQPRKGLTLIWPVDWTHVHRGVVSPTQDKYVITGWFDFAES